MSIKMLLSAGFAVHAIIGNFCMMPMAFAQGEMEMPHENHMEMDMTPMDTLSTVPVSPAHCEHCANVQLRGGDQSHRQSECAGHCFSQEQSTAASTASFNAPYIVAAASLPIAIAFAPQKASVIAPPATGPPASIHIDMIVLRL